MDASIEYLEKEETELRQTAANIKKFTEQITAEFNRLAEEKEHIKAVIVEQKGDISVRSKVIESLCQTSARNKEEIAQYEEKCRQQKDLIQQVGRNVAKAQLALNEIRVEIWKEKVIADTYDSVNLTIAQKEKIAELAECIKKFVEEHQEANASLALLNNHLNQCAERDQAHGLRFEEIEAQQRQIDALILDNDKKLSEIKDKMRRLSNQKKLLSAEFVDQERLLVKIKTCRKLKLLDRKEEGILGSELTVLKRQSENSRTTSNVSLNSTISY